MAVKRPGLKLASLLLLAVVSSTSTYAQYGEDDYGGYDGYYDGADDLYDEGAGAYTEDGAYYDEYNYYGDEDEEYYQYYGYYTEDAAGYEDYYADDYGDEHYDDCKLDAANKPVLSNTTTSCDIKISGVNAQADMLTGGLDGIYKLHTCYNGRALYKRADSPAKDDRVLWYSPVFGDWDVSNGTEPAEQEILMYGGEMEHASSPLYVSGWHLSSELRSTSTLGEDDYTPISVKVTCSDGKVPKQTAAAAAQQQRGGAGGAFKPYLTDAEMEAKYKIIYENYRKKDSSPTISFTFVVLLVMTGLTIVLAIPYFLLRKKGQGAAPLAKGGSGSNGNIASSFAQMLQQSKKKQSGHIN